MFVTVAILCAIEGSWKSHKLWRTLLSRTKEKSRTRPNRRLMRKHLRQSGRRRERGQANAGLPFFAMILEVLVILMLAGFDGINGRDYWLKGVLVT
jgi:hypothetical protein